MQINTSNTHISVVLQFRGKMKLSQFQAGSTVCDSIEITRVYRYMRPRRSVVGAPPCAESAILWLWVWPVAPCACARHRAPHRTTYVRG